MLSLDSVTCSLSSVQPSVFFLFLSLFPQLVIIRATTFYKVQNLALRTQLLQCVADAGNLKAHNLTLHTQLQQSMMNANNLQGKYE